MKDSNVVELREWFGKEASNGRASHEECLKMIRAFIQIRDPSLRTLLIRSAQAAAAKIAEDYPGWWVKAARIS